MRSAPDKDWEPVYRNNSASQYNDDYQRIMRELQTREIQPEDYELLLSLETRGNMISLPKFIALCFEKLLLPEKKAQYEHLRDAPMCGFCEMRIEDRGKGLMLRSCDHCLHKGCLEDMFRLKKNQCPQCQGVIAEGYERSLNTVKMKPNKVTKKKNKEVEEVK